MPRFFFHIRDGATLIEDPDGSELPDLAAAREEAAQGARFHDRRRADRLHEN
nr:hypothetical protein [Methylobacterium sp. Leaf122]